MDAKGAGPSASGVLPRLLMPVYRLCKYEKRGVAARLLHCMAFLFHKHRPNLHAPGSRRTTKNENLAGAWGIPE